jgi:D-inositol-3-phosphate glycosyltransferase
MDYYDYSLLTGLLRAGVKPRLYTSQGGPLAPPGLYIEELFRGVYGKAPKPYRAAKWIVALWKTMKDAVRHGVKIVHFHFFGTGLLDRIGIWFARQRRLKVVATIHDVESFHKKSRRAALASLLSSLDGIVVHNTISRDEVSSFMDKKPAALAVIPHGNYIDYVGRPLSRQDARERLGLPPKTPVFLFFGQIKKVKGLEIALRALALVRLSLPDAMLLIAGKIWKDDPSSYREVIHECRLEGNVLWHDGYVPQDRVDLYYYACDAVVLPYRRIYQSGVLLMALSYGIPVVASDLPGMSEIIKHDWNGYLFDAGDHEALAEALTRIIGQPQAARRIGEQGREYVRTHHDWDLIGKKTAEFYRRVLGEA